MGAGCNLERLRIASERLVQVSGGAKAACNSSAIASALAKSAKPIFKFMSKSTSRLDSPVMRRWALRIDSSNSGVIRRGPRSV